MRDDTWLAEKLSQWQQLRSLGQVLSAQELCAADPRADAEMVAELEKLISRLFTNEPTVEGTQGGASFSGPAVGELVSSTTTYRLVRQLAGGGQGHVFAAQDEEFNRDVAVKFLARPDDEQNLQRFAREIEVTSRLTHPGIVAIHGRGRRGLQPFYSMEWIGGRTLTKKIHDFHADGGSADLRSKGLRDLLGSLIAACRAVHYAHANGIVHRDIKPDNIMVGEFGETLVIDWGLAKQVAGSDPESQPMQLASTELYIESEKVAEATRGVMGTVSYMSPEQAEGDGDLDHRTDIYSLGATLYRVLTNETPFKRPASETDLPALLDKIRQGDFDSPRQVAASVPAPLSAICDKAMTRRPADRYQSAAALAEDLDLWLADQPVTAYADPWAVRTRRWMRRHQTVVMSSISIVTVSIVALVIGLWALGATNKSLRAAREDAKTQRQQAERTLRLSFNVISGMVDAAHNSKQDAAALADGQVEIARKFFRDFLKPVQRGSTSPADRLVAGLAHLHLANASYSRGQQVDSAEHTHDAIRILERLKEERLDEHVHWLELAQARFAYGQRLHAENHLSEAKDFFRVAKEEFLAAARLSSDGRTCNIVAWFLCTCPDQTYWDGEEAVRLARLAVDENEKSPGRRQTLGLAYYRAGEFERAVTELKKSNALVTARPPTDGLCVGNDLILAMSYQQLKKHAEARAELDAVEQRIKNQRLSLENERLLQEARQEIAAGQ